MIQMQSCMTVADNSGAKIAQCIKVLGGSHRRYAGIGDIVVVAIKDAIPTSTIKKGAVLDRVIVDQNTVIGENVKIGEGENTPNELKPKIYNTGITVIGSNTTVPDNLKIGKNCVIYGNTAAEDYKDNILESGKSVIVEEASL